MKASEAKAVSNQQRTQDFLGYLKNGMEGENPEEFLGIVVRTIVDENIRFISTEGRRSVMMEPFATIPGEMHLSDREDRLMNGLVDGLDRDGYQDVTWDRRDKRVILRFKW